MGLNPALLAKLAAAKRPPVLVMIGYDNDLRIDAAGRAYDYTLPLPAGLKQPPRSGGGADAFLQLIETRIKPAIAAKLAVDPQRQTLWGHSYGGLFVLHTLFTHPTAFQRYIAVEPSLWWGNGMILQEAQQMMARRPAPVARLQLWVGTAERDRAAPPGVKSPTLPADATHLLAEHGAARRSRRRLSGVAGLRTRRHAGCHHRAGAEQRHNRGLNQRIRRYRPHFHLRRISSDEKSV